MIHCYTIHVQILIIIFHIDSDEYRKMMEDREIEIMALSGSDERWENWMQYVQSRMLPRFTEHGYDVIDTPKHIQAKLKAMIDTAVKDFDNLPIEAGEGPFYGPTKAKFVELGEINENALDACFFEHEHVRVYIRIEDNYL